MKHFLLAGFVAAALAAAPHADDWGELATVSSTLGIQGNRLCLGESTRGDIGCPAYAPFVTAAGAVGIGTNVPSATLHLSGATPLVIQDAAYTYGFGYSLNANTQHKLIFGAISGSPFIRYNGGGLTFMNNSNPAKGYAFAMDHQNNVIVSGTLLAKNLAGIGLGGQYIPSATLHVSGTTRISSWTTIASNVTPTAELDVYGRVSATQFIGDGSQLTGVTAASSDRIVSGTTMVVANTNSGYVSFTSSGVTTGHYSPGGIFSAVGISTSSNQASFTSLYASGRVGIGTESPSASINIAGMGTQSIRITALNFGGGNNYYTEISNNFAGANRFDIRSGGDEYFGAVTTHTGGGAYMAGFGDLLFATGSSGAFAGHTSDKIRMIVKQSGQVGIGVPIYPSTTLHVSGTLRLANGGEACDANRSGAMRWDGTELQVCYGSGGWATLSSAAISGTLGGLDDRIVSGTAQVIAHQNTGISLSAPTEVSGTFRMAGTGDETCSEANDGLLRFNPVTRRLEMCRH